MRFLILALFTTFAGLAHAQSTPAIDARFSSITHTNGTAGVGVAEASDFTTVADTAGSLAGTYFTVHAAGDLYCIQPWYKVSGVGSAPVAVTGCTLVEVDIATGDTNSTVAGDTRTVLNAAPYTTYFAITGGTTHIIVTNLTGGVATDGNIGTSGFTVSKTQGVSGSAAISAGSILGGILGWRLCNNGTNTSTWLAVGSSLDPTVEGVRLGKGKCFECLQCTGGMLKAATVSAQAASNGYSVVQFKQ